MESRTFFFVAQLVNSKTSEASHYRVSYDPGQWIVEKHPLKHGNSCLQTMKLPSNLGYPPEAKHSP